MEINPTVASDDETVEEIIVEPFSAESPENMVSKEKEAVKVTSTDSSSINPKSDLNKTESTGSVPPKKSGHVETEGQRERMSLIFRYSKMSNNGEEFFNTFYNAFTSESSERRSEMREVSKEISENLKFENMYGSQQKPPKLMKVEDYNWWKNRFEGWVKAFAPESWLKLVTEYKAPEKTDGGAIEEKDFTELDVKHVVAEYRMITLIKQSVREDIISLLENKKTSKKLWEALERKCIGSNEIVKNKKNMLERFGHLKMELTRHGISYDEDLMVDKLFDSLPNDQEWLESHELELKRSKVNIPSHQQNVELYYRSRIPQAGSPKTAFSAESSNSVNKESLHSGYHIGSTSSSNQSDANFSCNIAIDLKNGQNLNDETAKQQMVFLASVLESYEGLVAGHFKRECRNSYVADDSENPFTEDYYKRAIYHQNKSEPPRLKQQEEKSRALAVIYDDEGYDWSKEVLPEKDAVGYAFVANDEHDKWWRRDRARWEIGKLYAPFQEAQRAERWSEELECYLDPYGNPVVDPAKVDFDAVTNAFPSEGVYNTKRLSDKNYLVEFMKELKEIFEIDAEEKTEKIQKTEAADVSSITEERFRLRSRRAEVKGESEDKIVEEESDDDTEYYARQMEKHLKMMAESDSEDEKAKKKKKKVKTPVSGDDETVPVVRRKVKEIPKLKESYEVLNKAMNMYNDTSEEQATAMKTLHGAIYPTAESLKAFEDNDVTEEKKVSEKKIEEKTPMKKTKKKKGTVETTSEIVEHDAMLWHHRLGHLNTKNLNRLAKGGLVRNLPIKDFMQIEKCDACARGKQHRRPHKSKPVHTTSKVLELLHMDLFGPVNKSETAGLIKKFVILMENQSNERVKIIHCDNGTIFKNAELNEFCALKGIDCQYNTARSPQQNAVAERRNHTLIEAARTMLIDSGLPLIFWVEAVNTAC
ncbi:uncharacterized protein LOC110943049 [Helianthus annuus]|uniref:uncharacterized protein LOC110943049 n=1 Tax=Helianthus annuus TaxID=4232 RepID=UPI000B8F964B|nr:uncharacterized protein LOC110943049 [Helianthus annuus]